MSKAPLRLALLCSALAVPAAAQEFTNPNGSSVKLYGQLNPAYLAFDDGEETNSGLVDNANSNSRAGLFVYWPFADDQKLTFNFEAALGFFQSSSMNINSFEGQQWYSWSESNIRKFEVFYDSSFGTVWAGQGSMATDGIAKFDYSKTTVIGGSAYNDVAGGFAFRETDGTLSSIKIGSVFRNLEGSRRMRLRYDTPDFNGFSFSVAAGQNVLSSSDNNNYADAGIRYENDFGDVKLGAGLGYAYQVDQDDSEDNSEFVMGSVSVLHVPTGLNGTIAAGENLDTGNYGYVKLGWIGDFWSVGTTSFAAEYYKSNDLGLDGSGESWGLMAVQAVKELNTEVYIGYRKYSLDSATTNYDDSASLMAGARWRF